MRQTAIKSRFGHSLIRFQLLVVVLLAGLLAGCGDDEGPGQITNPPLAFDVASGMFDITAWDLVSGCGTDSDYNGPYEITIDGAEFSMGDDWIGVWDDVKKRGSVETNHVKETFRLCTVTTWTEALITFSSEDEFRGYVLYRYRISGDCGGRVACGDSWGIKGVRQPAPPDSTG